MGVHVPSQVRRQRTAVSVVTGQPLLSSFVKRTNTTRKEAAQAQDYTSLIYRAAEEAN